MEEKRKMKRREGSPFEGGREGRKNEWLLLFWFSRKVEIIKEFLWRWHVKSIYKTRNRTSRTGARWPGDTP